VQGVSEESLIWSGILEPILHRKPVRETCFSVIDGKHQLKHRKPVRGDLLLYNRWQTSVWHAFAAKKVT